MIDILLCGDPSDVSVAQALIPALERCGGLCFVRRDGVAEHGDPVRFFLYESAFVPKIGMERGILLLKNNLSETSPVYVPPGFFCIISSRNAQAACMLRGSAAAVVTCGTGPTDTLSLAGMEGHEASVSLQRNLTALDGSVVEPRDIGVRLPRPRGPEQVLFVCAALLLAGVDPEPGYII